MSNIVSLRRATLDDVNFLKVIYNDKTIQNLSLNVDACKIEEKEIINTLNYFRENNLDFFVITKNTIEIGIALIYEINLKNNFVMAGIALAENYRGKNISHEIIQILTKHILNNYKITFLCGEVYSNNNASLRLVEKLGFIRDDSKTKLINMNGIQIYSYVYNKHINDSLQIKIVN